MSNPTGGQEFKATEFIGVFGKTKGEQVYVICVKNSLVSRERHDMKEGINVEDCVWREIPDYMKRKILVGCFYRAHGVMEEQERVRDT